MKKIGSLVIASVLLLPLYGLATMLAYGAFDNSRVIAQETTTDDGSATDTEQSRKEAMENRLRERKEQRKVRLSGAQKTRLQSRCKGSQGGISRLKGRINGIETSRTQVYTNLVNRLEKFSEKLTAKGLDASELDANIATLTEMIEEFNTDLANYKEAVADLAEMDCASDVDAFKASLDTARELRQKLHETGLEIRTFVKQTIKQTLKDIKAQINGTSSDDSDGDSNEESDSDNDSDTEENDSDNNESNEETNTGGGGTAENE